jgi:hypothetical protein
MKEKAGPVSGTMTLVVATNQKEKESETLKGMSFQETREMRMKN